MKLPWTVIPREGIEIYQVVAGALRPRVFVIPREGIEIHAMRVDAGIETINVIPREGIEIFLPVAAPPEDDGYRDPERGN